VATTERWKDRDGNRQERTEWHTAVFWGQLAKVAGEYLKKGRHVLIGGPLRSREYEDRDGIRRKVWEIAADEFILLDKAAKRPESDEQFPPETADAAA
jgi:single-strand DNA-binding protein